MNGIISNGVIQGESRPGWILNCPSCNQEVKYTVLNLSGGHEPFLYCNKCSNFVLRDDDLCHVTDVSEKGNIPTVVQLRQIYQDIEAVLEPCSCGGRFEIWANVKCPHCNMEFPYNNGVRSEEIRYSEPKVIWVEGTTAFRGSQMASNRLATVQVR